MRGADARPWPRGSHPRGGDRVDRVGIAQAAPGLLEVGLEQERELAAALRALGVQRLELGQPGAGRHPPVRQHAERSSAVSVGVTGDVPGVEEAQRGAQVARGATSRPSRGVRTAWSRRVPESQIGYQIRSASMEMSAPPGVQEQHVEVAAGQQLAAAVPADGHQGHAGLAAEQRSQPAVGLGGTPGTISAERDSPAVPSWRARPGPGRPAVREPPGRVHRCARARPRPPGRTRPFHPRSGRSAPP